jgi:type IV pilus assembly protein PilO
VADLLVDVSQTGLASGLEFELFKPQGEVQKDFYAELPISISVVGSYLEFGGFVSGLASLPRIVTVHDTVITPIKGGEKLRMNATVRTYRYLDEEG